MISYSISLVTGLFVSYALYKYNKITQDINKNTNKYTVFKCENYATSNPARVYKSNIVHNNDILPECKKSLLGYDVKFEQVNQMINKYLQEKPITSKRVIFDTEGWIGDIQIETNTNPNTLVFYI